MPIYEYRCEACGHTLDALQKLNDEPLKECPECSAAALKRLVSAPSFRLKGGGWYETDFKSEKDKRRNLAERPNEAAGKDGKDGKAKEDKTKKEDKTSKEAKPAGESGTKKTAEKSSSSTGTEAA